MPVRRLLLTLPVACIVGLSACDSLLVDPAEPRGADVEVVFDPRRAGAPATQASGEAPFGVREVRLSFSRGDYSRDTVTVGRFRAGRLNTTVWLRADELTEELEIEADIAVWEGLALFSGSGFLSRTGLTWSAHLEMTPEEAFAFLVPGGVAFAGRDGTARTMHEGVPAEWFDLSPKLDGALVYHPGSGAATADIYLMDPYTGATRRVLGDEQEVTNPLWPSFSPDGDWIFFTDSPTERIMRVRTDGTDLEVVLGPGPTAGPYLRVPAPAFDGRRVSYGGDVLHVHDMTTGVTRALGVVANTTRWSPDDEWIAYRTRLGLLRRIRPDGTDDRALSFDRVHPVFDWTADGSFVVAASMSTNVAVRIEVATGNVEVLPALGEVLGITAHP